MALTRADGLAGHAAATANLDQVHFRLPSPQLGEGPDLHTAQLCIDTFRTQRYMYLARCLAYTEGERFYTIRLR